ncbi:ECF transporter S component [Caldanaerobius polysaccharolyticus]|uniref:ECF transporter S component n=1 Tax=Caldanaerobius polysaccharolyticus TaxID=44256 RepID=UPI000479747E
MSEKTKHIAVLGLLMALLIAATAVTKFAIPKPSIYFNLGEAVIYLVALLYGGKTGGILGGVGSALADLISGYPIWAPFTFVIKGLEGFIVGSVNRKKDAILAITLGAPVMLIGYSISAGLIYGIGAIPLEFAGDLIQVTLGAIIAVMVYKRLKNTVRR